MYSFEWIGSVRRFSVNGIDGQIYVFCPLFRFETINVMILTALNIEVADEIKSNQISE
jgi:hypothetical protein